MGRWARALLKGLGLLLSNSTDCFAVVLGKAKADHLKLLTAYFYTLRTKVLLSLATVCVRVQKPQLIGEPCYSGHHTCPESPCHKSTDQRDKGLQHISSTGVAATNFQQDWPITINHKANLSP